MIRAGTLEDILQLGYAFRGAKALMSAIELGVFTVLAENPLNGEALRGRLSIAERGARDFFDALVALGLLHRDNDGTYANAPACARYLDARKADYIGGLIENLSAREYATWGALTEALRTGRPQTGFEANAHFGQLYADPERQVRFLKGMSGASLLAARRLAEKFPWQKFNTVADIGTAEGCVPVQLSLAHPHLKAKGFDLPILENSFRVHAARHGLSDRLTFVAGDFFTGPLPTADVLVMGRVLHNWNLPTKRMLLGKAFAALPVGGALIVYERLIDDARQDSIAGLLSSLNMLIMTEGGFDFSAADCIGWMRDADFRDARCEPLCDTHFMIVATK